MYQIVEEGSNEMSYRIFDNKDEPIELINYLNALLVAIGFLPKYSLKAV